MGVVEGGAFVVELAVGEGEGEGGGAAEGEAVVGRGCGEEGRVQVCVWGVGGSGAWVGGYLDGGGDVEGEGVDAGAEFEGEAQEGGVQGGEARGGG